MGAFKTGFRIGVCCEDRDKAIAFMSLMFDEPEHKKFSPYGVEFKYDNGDLIEWIKPIENVRGKRFDFVFCEDLEQNRENESFINDILRPICTLPNIRIGVELDKFNANSVNKFTLIR